MSYPHSDYREQLQPDRADDDVWRQRHSPKQPITASSSHDVDDNSCTCVNGHCHYRQLRRSERIRDGQTCLHLVCQERECCVPTIRRLVAEYPEAVVTRDMYGRVPIFYALKGAHKLEVIQILFDSCPMAILQRDFCGDLPFYFLLHPSTDHRILEYVLKNDPSLALYKESSISCQSLVQRVFTQWTKKMTIYSDTSTVSTRQLQVQNHSSERNSNGGRYTCISRTQFEIDPICKDYWTKVVLTVRAAYRYANRHVQDRGESPSSYASTAIHELHVALDLPCPPAILCQFIELYPEQAAIPMVTRSVNENLYEMNYDPTAMGKQLIRGRRNGAREDDRCDCSDVNNDNSRDIRDLPLHYYLSRFRREGVNSQAGTMKYRGLPIIFYAASSSSSSPTLHPSSHASVLRSLLRAFPTAAGIRSSVTDQLAIHMAISAGFTWSLGLQELVYADPSVLDQQDVESAAASAVAGVGCCLLPFMNAAAFRNTSSSICDLDTVYCLLHENPAVLSGFVQRHPAVTQ